MIRTKHELKQAQKDPKMKELIDTLWREYYGLYLEKYKTSFERDELGELIDPWLLNEIDENIHFGQAFGQDHKIFGNRSLGVGMGHIVRSFLEIALGSYSTEDLTQNIEKWIPTDRLITVGNGPDKDNRNNALIIFKNGIMKLFNSIVIGQWDAGIEGQVPDDGSVQFLADKLEVFYLDEWHDLHGRDGLDGAQGIQGIPGQNGADGLPGIQGIQGPTGDTGTKGDQGIQGIQGITGADGQPGEAGAQGVPGIQGLPGQNGTDGQPGAQGLQGIQGIKGDTGAKGDQGIQGIHGFDGSDGADGLSGPKGDQGIQGVQGLSGSQGLQGVQGNTGATGGAGPGGTPQTLSNLMFLLYNDEADSTEIANVITESAALKTYSLAANTYNKIIIEVVVRNRVEQDANIKCDFTWRIKSAGTTVKTYIQRVIASNASGADSGGRYTDALSFVMAGGQVSATALTLTVQNSLANAATGSLVHAFRVYGVDDFVVNSQGPQGVQGLQGTQGITGLQGIQGTQGVAGLNGTNGATGESAYQTALDNGFIGTEIQWLASIKGEKGDAGDLGIQGIQGIQGLQGNTGLAGKTAYQTALDNGFIGTEIQWLANMKGEKGDAGDQGVQGVQGTQGVQGNTGIAGKTAYQTAIENGFIGTENQWIASLKGETGEQGIQGIQGIQGVQGNTGTTGDSAYQTALEGGFIGTKQQWIASLKGATGDQGLQGVQGIQGVKGDSYVFIAFASNNLGADFTMLFDENLDYIAFKSLPDPIANPTAADFTGLWKNFKGVDGTPGAAGIQGPAGIGLPVGGYTNQKLVKKSNADYDFEWVNEKEYTAFITQTGTNDPTTIELENTIGAMVLTRTALGTYRFTLAGAFIIDKTTPIDDIMMDQSGNIFTLNRISADQMELKTYPAANLTILADGILNKRYINFKVFE